MKVPGMRCAFNRCKLKWPRTFFGWFCMDTRGAYVEVGEFQLELWMTLIACFQKTLTITEDSFVFATRACHNMIQKFKIGHFHTKRVFCLWESPWRTHLGSGLEFFWKGGILSFIKGGTLLTSFPFSSLLLLVVVRDLLNRWVAQEHVVAIWAVHLGVGKGGWLLRRVTAISCRLSS
jgi:hypothetical protein